MDAQAGDALSQRIRIPIEDMRAQWVELDHRIAEFDKELAGWARNDEAARRLMIPGIGILNATALIAAIGHGTCAIAAESIWDKGGLRGLQSLIPRWNFGLSFTTS
jgi:transposase